MLFAVEYKNRKIGIYDNMDNTVEFLTSNEIKLLLRARATIVGVLEEKDVNPIYTFEGLTINLYYRDSISLGKFKAVYLKEGDHWGHTFSTIVKKPTIAFFDDSVSWSRQKYPLGQYVASYYAETIMSHNGKLVLNAEIDKWQVPKEDIEKLKDWLSKHELGNIELWNVIDEKVASSKEIFREILEYGVGNQTAYMMVIIDSKGCIDSYNMDNNHYYTDEYGTDSKPINEFVLSKLKELSKDQGFEDFKKKGVQFTLEGYDFEGKIVVNGEKLICSKYICDKDKFINSLKSDYNLMLEEREIDREASFYEYLSTLITGHWIEHNIKLCAN